MFAGLERPVLRKIEQGTHLDMQEEKDETDGTSNRDSKSDTEDKRKSDEPILV